MKPVSIHPDRLLLHSGGLGSIILLLLAAVSIAAAIPAARASGEADLLTALRAKGAQVVPLGSRGGLAGYFVRPAKGAGYSLYLTATGHAVAGLLYGPDGALITEDQLATAAAVKAAEMSSNRAGSVARADVSSISPERFDGSATAGWPVRTPRAIRRDRQPSNAPCRSGANRPRKRVDPDTSSSTCRPVGALRCRVRFHVGRTRPFDRPVRRCALSVVAFRGSQARP